MSQTGPVVNPVPKWASTEEDVVFADPGMAGISGVNPPPTQDPPMRQFRGATLGQSFHFRERMKLSREKPMMGIWYGAFPYPNIARIIGQAGFDYVFMDWEHTPYSTESVCEIIRWIQYASEGNTAVIVRVPGHEHWQISWLLDAGASGVVLPHTESVAQAKAAVANVRFPAYGGIRSAPPNATLMGYNDGAEHGGGALESWNRAAVIMQIESAEGVRHADEIAAVEGVDGVMVGPGDLGLDMKLTFATMWTDKNWQANVGTVVAAAKKHNKAAMMPSLNPMCKMWLDMGFTMVMSCNDGNMFTKAVRADLAAGYEQLNAWRAENGKGGKDANATTEEKK